MRCPAAQRVRSLPNAGHVVWGTTGGIGAGDVAAQPVPASSPPKSQGSNDITGYSYDHQPIEWWW